MFGAKEIVIKNAGNGQQFNSTLTIKGSLLSMSNEPYIYFYGDLDALLNEHLFDDNQ